MVTLLLTFLGHGLADFIFQSDGIVKKKSNFQWDGFLIHGLITFFILILLLHWLEFPSALLYAATITVLHILLDFCKCLMTSSGNPRLDLSGFLLDQLGHGLIIFGTWQFFNLEPNPRLTAFYWSLLQPKTLAAFAHSMDIKPQWTSSEAILLITSYIYVCCGGTFLVRKFLNCLNYSTEHDHLGSKFQSGTYIGILERLLIMIFVQSNTLPSVVFILTAKSIARFNELSEKNFAEYYLVGTLYSTALAICGGYLLNFFQSIIH